MVPRPPERLPEPANSQARVTELESQLADALRAAGFWERQAVYRASAVAAALLDQIALARALARVVERYLSAKETDTVQEVEEALQAFWRSAGRADHSGC